MILAHLLLEVCLPPLVEVNLLEVWLADILQILFHKVANHAYEEVPLEARFHSHQERRLGFRVHNPDLRIRMPYDLGAQTVTELQRDHRLRSLFRSINFKRLVRKVSLELDACGKLHVLFVEHEKASLTVFFIMLAACRLVLVHGHNLELLIRRRVVLFLLDYNL